MPKRVLSEVINSNPLIKLRPDDTTKIAAEAMRDHHVGSVLVVEGNDLRGILTERDIIERVIAAGLDPGETHISAVMTCEPTTVDPSTTVMEALRVMREAGMRHLPVCRAGNVISIVSMRDFVPREMRDLDLQEEVCEALMQRIA